MTNDRPRFFDDIAGVAGGAISALAGLREEAEALAKARVDDVIQRLDLVRREEFEAAKELAANARAGQEAAEATVASMAARLAALEARGTALESPVRDEISQIVASRRTTAAQQNCGHFAGRVRSWLLQVVPTRE